MADTADTVLSVLANIDGFDTIDLANELKLDHQKLVGAIKSLQSLEDVSCWIDTLWEQ